MYIISAQLTSLSAISASDYTIKLYPTDELYNKYITYTPTIVGVCVGMGIIFVTLIVLLYDRLTSKQSKGIYMSIIYYTVIQYNRKVLDYTIYYNIISISRGCRACRGRSEKSSGNIHHIILYHFLNCQINIFKCKKIFIDTK
jgi:hypothetical protein